MLKDLKWLFRALRQRVAILRPGVMPCYWRRYSVYRRCRSLVSSTSFGFTRKRPARVAVAGHHADPAAEEGAEVEAAVADTAAVERRDRFGLAWLRWNSCASRPDRSDRSHRRRLFRRHAARFAGTANIGGPGQHGIARRLARPASTVPAAPKRLDRGSLPKHRLRGADCWLRTARREYRTLVGRRRVSSTRQRG
jgi:hypothetical protein